MSSLEGIHFWDGVPSLRYMIYLCFLLGEECPGNKQNSWECCHLKQERVEIAKHCFHCQSPWKYMKKSLACSARNCYFMTLYDSHHLFSLHKNTKALCIFKSIHTHTAVSADYIHLWYYVCSSSNKIAPKANKTQSRCFCCFLLCLSKAFG